VSEEKYRLTPKGFAIRWLVRHGVDDREADLFWPEFELFCRREMRGEVDEDSEVGVVFDEPGGTVCVLRRVQDDSSSN